MRTQIYIFFLKKITIRKMFVLIIYVGEKIKILLELFLYQNNICINKQLKNIQPIREYVFLLRRRKKYNEICVDYNNNDIDNYGKCSENKACR